MSPYDFVALFQAKNTPATGVVPDNAACSGCAGMLHAAGLAKDSWHGAGVAMGLGLLLPDQPGARITSPR